MRWHNGRWYTLFLSFSGLLTALDYPEAKQKLFERGFCIWLGISMEGLKFYFLAGIIHGYYSPDIGKHFLLDRHWNFSRRETKVPTTLKMEFVVITIVAEFLNSPLNQKGLLMIDLVVANTGVLELTDSLT